MTYHIPIIYQVSPSDLSQNGRFHKWGYPNRWFLSWQVPPFEMDELGASMCIPILGNLHMTWNQKLEVYNHIPIIYQSYTSQYRHLIYQSYTNHISHWSFRNVIDQKQPTAQHWLNGSLKAVRIRAHSRAITARSWWTTAGYPGVKVRERWKTHGKPM